MRRAEVSRGGAEARESEPVPAKNRREQFTRRFAPFTPGNVLRLACFPLSLK
jgi:hypothetical protein